jgi:PAS domain S-box-containing protein
VSVVQVFSAEIERDATGQPIRVFGAVQDITERQRAESTLRVREEQLRLYAEHSPVAVAMFDRAMNYLMVSRRWLEDYRLGNQSLVGRSHYEVFPEVPQRWRETYQRCLAGAVEKCDEEEFPRADGKTDWIRWEIRPWHQADNSIGGIIIFSEDITQRKRAEQALRHSELRFGSIFQENPVALALSEFETGKFLEVNDTLLRVMKATSRDQMVGRNSIEIGMISETERARLVRLVKTQGRVEQFITEMHRLDGEAFTADLCIGSYEDEGRRFLLTSLVDITERKSAEESHARLATVVEQSSETIVITDTKGTILYANPAFEKSTGYTRAETIGQNPRVLKSGKQGDEFYRAMWETLERGEVWHGHFINRHKNGALYEEDAAISPVRDVAGRIVSYAAVKRDVTREVQLERQLVEAQKMESVGQLAGGVAHDFNNMLAATMMNLSLLQMDKTLKPEARETISELIKEAERAASLTRQLLLFSRRSVMDVKLLDLSDLVTNLLKMLCRLIGEQVVVRFARRAGLPPLEGDAGMIEQVVMNLAVNARDAMPKGGEIDIGIEVVKVNEERLKGQPAVQAGPFLCLSVADSGCGMDEATRQRIFEPFFTTKEPGKGTGLGLATVHGIVAQHKGWVEVESEVGKGTTFKVFLPASTKRRSEAAPVAQPAVKGGEEAILVVEDEASVRRLVALTLRKLGYAVFVAENGQAALNLWQERCGEFDLLFSDMVMPEGLTGLDLSEKLRKEKPNLKVIISSGYSGETTGRSRLAANGIIYLQKPYRTENLAKVVRDCLDGKC